MREQGSLARLKAELAMKGITRREAASRLYLSYSQLNKKLRGAAPLSAAERLALHALCLGEGPGGAAQSREASPATGTEAGRQP